MRSRIKGFLQNLLVMLHCHHGLSDKHSQAAAAAAVLLPSVLAPRLCGDCQMGTRSAYLTTRFLPPPTWRPFSAVMACSHAAQQPGVSFLLSRGKTSHCAFGMRDQGPMQDVLCAKAHSSCSRHCPCRDVGRLQGGPAVRGGGRSR
jgi:hypothetical protein